MRPRATGAWRAWGATALVAGALVACTPTPAPEDGPTLFTQRCASCHGPNGSGVTPSGVILAVDLRDPDRQGRLTDEEIANVIRHGTGDMAPIRGLDAVELDRLVAYVRSLANQDTP